jgi:hypothetical protein
VFHSQTTPLSLPSTVNTAQATPISPQPHHAGITAQYRTFLGQHWYFKGVPLFSEKGIDWMSSKIGQRPALGKFRLFGSHSSPLSPFQPRAELPERETVHELLESWMSSDGQLLYPVLDPDLVQETVEAAYALSQDPVTYQRQRTAEACILAFLALSSLFKSDDTVPDLLDGNVYANSSHSYLTQTFEGSTMETLETVVMLVSMVKILFPPSINNLVYLQDFIRPVGGCRCSSFTGLPYRL